MGDREPEWKSVHIRRKTFETILKGVVGKIFRSTPRPLGPKQKPLAVITVRKHSVHGGLREVCAVSFVGAGIQCRSKSSPFPTEETVMGARAHIFGTTEFLMKDLSKC